MFIYHLLNDPAERSNLGEQTMDTAWVFGPVFQRIGAFQQSVAKYPNVKTGEEFSGYKDK